MKQKHIPHTPGTFAVHTGCGKEPRHYRAIGRTAREGVAFAVVSDRHSLECSCRRSTGWCASLAEAVAVWGQLGETLPLPLPATVDNVRPIRARPKGRAQA